MDKRGEIIKALKTLDSLPSLNSSILTMQEKLRDPDSVNIDFGAIAAIVEKDIGLTAKLLRTANSPAFAGRYERTGNLKQAISRLGITQVCKICLIFSSMQLFPKVSSLINLIEFWHHSISTAMVLRTIAKKAKSSDYNDGNEYMAGLLHDIGILLFDRHFYDDYCNIRTLTENGSKEIYEVENEILGINHAEIGGMLLERWRLPDEIVQCVTYHHNPDAIQVQFQPAARRLQLADFACSVLGASEPGVTIPQNLSFSAWDELGCDSNTMTMLINTVKKELERSSIFVEIGM